MPTDRKMIDLRIFNGTLPSRGYSITDYSINVVRIDGSPFAIDTVYLSSGFLETGHLCTKIASLS